MPFNEVFGWISELVSEVNGGARNTSGLDALLLDLPDTEFSKHLLCSPTMSSPGILISWNIQSLVTGFS